MSWKPVLGNDGLYKKTPVIDPTPETDPLSLHLDQTTPQTVINGSPRFSVGIKLKSPDGTWWIITIANDGSLVSNKAGSPIGLLLALTYN